MGQNSLDSPDRTHIETAAAGSIDVALDDAFFRALFHSQLGGIAVADLNTFTIIETNELLLEILGRDAEDIVGVPMVWLELTPPEYHELDERAIAQVMEIGRSEPFEKEYLRSDGSRVPVRVSSVVVPGYPDKLIVFVADVTQERAAHERERAIQQRLEIAISAAEQGVWDWDLVTGEMVYSPRAKEIYGLPLDEAVTFEVIRDATHPEDAPNTHALLTRAIDPAIRDRSSYEYRIILPDGGVRWVLAYGEAVFEGPPGAEKAVRYAGTIQDITIRKTAERYQELLIAELNHRVKNTLAVVQSLAHQTFRPERSPAEAVAAYEGRLSALAAAHNLLTRARWEAAAMAEVVAEALGPFCVDRCTYEGPDLRLPPQMAVSLSLAMHELATNAQKYGALSNDRGHVDVRWARSGDRLVLTWSESGGPEVHEPTSTGFGTRMLKRALATDLRGSVDLDYAASGVVCRIDAALPPL